MQQYLRICPICVKENIREIGHSKIYVPGCVDYLRDETAKNMVCNKHKVELEKVSITCEEFQVLRNISNNPEFIIQMNRLKEDDIIEYESRMSQFRTQVEQKQKAEVNKPKCPTCKSTNIKKISSASKAANTFAWGIFGTKRLKTFHCNLCGYEW